MTILGVDYGEKRIGLAVSDSEGIIAHPLTMIETRDRERAIRDVAAVVVQRQVELVVVGMPLNMDGSAGAKARETAAFITSLRASVQCPVETWDERLTTVAAERELRRAGLSSDKRKERRDKIAAQMLLQSYLDARRSRRLSHEKEEGRDGNASGD